MKEWKKSFCTNSSQIRAEVTAFISDKIDFRSKIVAGGKEGHHMIIKRSLHEQNVTLANKYLPNTN